MPEGETASSSRAAPSSARRGAEGRACCGRGSPPLARIGAGDALGGEASERALGIGIGVERELPPEPGGEAGQRDLAVAEAAGVADRESLGQLRQIEPAQERRGLLLLVVDRGNEHPLAAPRERGHEHPGLVVEHGTAAVDDRRGPLVAERLLEPAGAEEGVAHAEVRPHALVHADEHDRAPLAADRAGGRREHDGVGVSAAAKRVVDDGVAPPFGEEARERGAGFALDEPLRAVEEHDEGVEPPVQLGRADAAAQRDRLPRGGALGAAPGLEEHGVDRVAVGEPIAHPAQRVDEVAHGAGRARPGRAGERVEHLGADRVAAPAELGEDGVGEDVQAGALGVRLLGVGLRGRLRRVGRRVGAEPRRGLGKVGGPAHPAELERVDAVQRRGEDALQPAGVPQRVGLAAHGELAEVEDRADGRVVARGEGRRRRGRDARAVEGARELRQAGAGAGDHRQLAPRHPLDEVQAAQVAGGEIGLLARRRAVPHRRSGQRVVGGRGRQRARRPPVRALAAHPGASGRCGDQRPQLGAVAVHRRQQDAPGRGFAGPAPVRRELGAAAVEGAGREVGVAEGHDARAVAFERGEQAPTRFGELLGVVDDDELEVGEHPAGLALGDEPGRLGERGRRVERALVPLGEHVFVVTGEDRRARPERPVPLTGARRGLRAAGERREAIGPDAELGHRGEQRPQLVAEAAQPQRLRVEPGRPAGVAADARHGAPEVEGAVDDLGEDRILLRAGEQLRRRRPAPGAIGGDELHGHRGHRAPEGGAAGGVPDARVQPVAQGGGEAPVRRDGEDALGRRAGGDARGDELDERRRLAAAGRADHRQGVGARGLDDRPLTRVEFDGTLVFAHGITVTAASDTSSRQAPVYAGGDPHPTERRTVEIRIGILHSPRELTFETDASAAEIERLVVNGDGSPVVRFTDDKGRVVLVNRELMAYVEIGEETQRRVGFVA